MWSCSPSNLFIRNFGSTFLTMYSRVSALLLITIFLSPKVTHAEDMTGKVKRAVERITLAQDGTPPFHLKAALAPTYERDKDSGRNGGVEIWWVAHDRWKREVRCSEFHQIDIVNGKQEWQKNEGDYFPEWLREMAVELINPVPDLQEVLEHVKTAEVGRMFNQVNISWITNTGTAEVHNIIRSGFALNADGQVSSGYGFGWGGDFKDYHKFHQRIVAHKVSWLSPEVTATVTTLEDLGQVPDTFFETEAPGADLQPLHTMLLDELTFRRNLLPTDPVVWPTVENGPFRGNVTTDVVVDREGRVRDIEGVVSENGAMNDPGKDAVRKMRFKPFLVDGIPVQVMSQFTLSFKTDRPAGSENFESAESYFERGRLASFPAAAKKAPYALKAEFQYASNGAVQTGHYGDTWLSDSQWLRKAEGSDSFCERSADGKKLYRDMKGSTAGLMCLVLKILEPIPAIDTFTESDWRIGRDELDGVPTIRLFAGPQDASGNLEPQSRGYWFDSSGLLVKTHFSGIETRRSDFQDFNGVRAAHRIDVLKDGRLAMKIAITDISSAPSATADNFKLKGHEWERKFTDEVR